MVEKLSTWYECKVRMERTMENGALKKVTEIYVVEAMSYTEAEAKIIEEMTAFCSGEFEIKGIKEAPYKLIFFSDSTSACVQFFLAKLTFFIIDEKTGNEKRSAKKFLVEADGFRDAIDKIDKNMSGTMYDYLISSLSETQIFDVYQYEK